MSLMWSWHWSLLTQTSLLMSPSDGLASFLKTTLANGIKVVKKVITSKFRFHLIAIYALGCFSVGNHFFQTLAKMASGLKLLLAKMKKSSPCLASDIFFKLANKYQINNTVMFNNLFCRFWQVINLVKKDQHSLKSCVDLFFLNFVVFVF
jgi:hypothetical protein